MGPHYIRNRADFDRVVHVGRTAESATLEFKSQIDNWRRDMAVPTAERDELRRQARLEFVRDVAQFVNTDGGTLLIGVREAPGPTGLVAGSPHPISIADVQPLRQWMEAAIRNHTVPNTYEPEIVPIEVEGGSILAINIEPRADIVSVWDPRDRFIQVPVRLRNSKYLLNVDEAEALRMNNDRAARLRFAQATEGGKRTFVNLAGIIVRRIILAQTIQNDILTVNGRITVGPTTESVFDLVIPVGSNRPTITVPYGAIDYVWVDDSQSIGLVLRFPIVMLDNRFSLDAHPLRR